MTATTLITTRLTPAVTPARALRAALVELAARCDGAHALDDKGFSASDTTLGCYLAALPASDWSADELAVAAEMARRYHRQLNLYGVDVDALPTPDAAQGATVRDAARRHARDEREARERAIQEAAAQERQATRERLEAERRREAEERVGLRWDGERLTLVAGYDEARIVEVKAVPTRRWDGQQDTFSACDLEAVEGICTTYNVPVRLTAGDRVSIVAVAAEDAARPHVTLCGDRTHITTPFNRALVTACQTARGEWNGTSWVFGPRKTLDAVLVAAQFDLRIAPDVEARADAQLKKVVGDLDRMTKMPLAQLRALAELYPQHAAEFDLAQLCR